MPPTPGMRTSFSDGVGTVVVSRRSPVPPALTIQRSVFTSSWPRVKTIEEPSGDHAGLKSHCPVGGVVRVRTPVPSGFMTTIRPVAGVLHEPLQAAAVRSHDVDPPVALERDALAVGR